MEKQELYQPKNTVIVFDLNGVVLHLSPWQVLRIAWRSPYKWRMLALAFNPAFDWYILQGLYRKQVVEKMINDLTVRFKLFAPLRATALQIVNAQYPRAGMAPLIKNLHDRGYELAILTNIGQESINMLMHAHPELFAQFKHVIHATADDGYIAKPDHQAFAKLFLAIGDPTKKYLFIDDNRRNIAQARVHGMQAIRFYNMHNLQKQLKKRGIV